MGQEGKRTLPQSAVDDAQIGLQKWHIELQDEQIAKQSEQISEDYLTGLKNRKFLMNALSPLFRRTGGETVEHRREGVSLIFIDLDHFKEINDSLGHAGGDNILKEVAGLLKSVLRGTDIPVRYAGDEFVVLLPNTNEEHAAVAAQHILTSLKKLKVTASLGVCSSNVSTATSPEDFIRHADTAAYLAKQGGRNQVVVYRDGMEMNSGK